MAANSSEKAGLKAIGINPEWTGGMIDFENPSFVCAIRTSKRWQSPLSES
jgi:hypothetical protein